MIDQIANALGCPEGSTLEKVNNLLADSAKHQTKVDALNATIEANKVALAEAENKLKAFEDAKKAEQEKTALALVENAVKARKITEAQKEKWLEFAKADLEGTTNLIEGLPSVQNLTDFTKSQDGKGAGAPKDETVFEARNLKEVLNELKADK